MRSTSNVSRRRVLETAAGAMLAAPLAALAQEKEPAMRPRVAALITTWFIDSHADVIVGKFLEGCDTLDVSFKARSQVVSMFVEQVGDRDISREFAERNNVPIFPTIPAALTLGGDDLAVDAILLIGEHGRYPRNEKRQVLYPRRRFFEEAAAVVRRSGRRGVPIFNDKHLSQSWQDAKFMVDTARELGMPFMAGSSLPLTWRKPELEFERGVRIAEAMGVGYSGVEGYGFHAVETLQCMIERRAGGETGVKAITALTGDAVWEAGDAGRWSWDLLRAALATSTKPIEGDVKDVVRRPAAFLVEYADGTRGSVLMVDGKTRQFLFAAQLEGQQDPVATCFWLQDERPHGHFAVLSDAIDRMFVSGNPTYPVERTLLTTGILDRCMTSIFEGGARQETPELAAVRYQPPAVPRPLRQA